MKIHIYCSYTEVDKFHEITTVDFVIVPRIGESIWIAKVRYVVVDIHYEVPGGEPRLTDTVIPTVYARKRSTTPNTAT